MKSRPARDKVHEEVNMSDKKIIAVNGGTGNLGGALAQRWLFFAQAEHVVGLFYGQR